MAYLDPDERIVCNACAREGRPASTTRRRCPHLRNGRAAPATRRAAPATSVAARRASMGGVREVRSAARYPAVRGTEAERLRRRQIELELLRLAAR